MTNHPLSGVYAAAITPLNDDFSIALDDIPNFLSFLANRGCHGALLLGTTGEGPSFATDERLAIFKAALKVREVHPEFRLLAGTGTPSLEETITITKSAFDLGFEGAVVLPPYFFHQATEDGLYQWFQELIRRAVPEDGHLLGYHFPAQSGVPIPLGVLSRLRGVFPRQFIGLKDSTANAEHTHQVGVSLDENIVALVGNDKLLVEALDAGGSGCITAMANLHSPSLREIWDAHKNGEAARGAQEYIITNRNHLDGYQPFAPTIKALISELHDFPTWAVRPPLTPLPKIKIEELLLMMSEL
jgi:4-hydroxy-tetrahydrodipicolinate synthase